MASKNNPTTRKTDIIVQEMNDEVLIYDLQIDKAYCLNETSATVYQLCDGSNSVADIKQAIGGKLKKPVGEDLIWLALDQLKENNLLEKSNELEINFNGMSRREVIRKAGFASMIALPIISSLIAPTTANAASAAVSCSAASGRPNGCTCNGVNDCASGCCGRTESSTNQCTSGGDPTGSRCRAGCECASGTCANNGTFLACT